MAKKDDEIKQVVLQRLGEKDKVWLTRMNVLEYQSSILRKLVPITIQNNARSGMQNGFGYGSGIFHKIVNFLSGSKLAPTFIDFKHEQTRVGEDLKVMAENVSDIHYLMRKKGDWNKANTDAMGDLIRGECFIQRCVKKNDEGEAIGFTYEYIPFVEMRWMYDGDTDVIRASELTRDQVREKFGDKIADTVEPSLLYSEKDYNNYRMNSVAQTNKDQQEKYSYIHYVNTATREEYEILGEKVLKKKTKDKFDLTSQDGDRFVPYIRRVMYTSVEESNFGYGMLDICLPLLRADSTHGNSVIKRSIDQGDSLAIVSGEDPTTLERQYMNHMANRAVGKAGNLMFVPGRGAQSAINLQQVSTPTDASIFEFIEDFIIDRISMLTDVNLRGLLEFAPTEAQDARRQEFQDKVALGVLARNLVADSEFAAQDLIMLKAYDTKFHDREVYLKVASGEFEGEDPELVGLLKDEDGEIAPEKIQIREFLKTVDDFDFDVTPRLDGVLDDASRFEINAQRADISLIPVGTPAYAKAIENYFAKTNPKLKITEDDLLPPAPEAPAPPL